MTEQRDLGSERRKIICREGTQKVAKGKPGKLRFRFWLAAVCDGSQLRWNGGRQIFSLPVFLLSRSFAFFRGKCFFWR